LGIIVVLFFEGKSGIAIFAWGGKRTGGTASTKPIGWTVKEGCSFCHGQILVSSSMEDFSGRVKASVEARLGLGCGE
jgi:hypothetical protein